MKIESRIIQGGGSFTVERFTTTYDLGIPKRVLEAKFDIRASVQPLTGREILQMDEGDRLKDHRNVYTKTDLKQDDLITVGEKVYRILIIWPWGSYTKARAVLKDV